MTIVALPLLLLAFLFAKRIFMGRFGYADAVAVLHFSAWQNLVLGYFAPDLSELHFRALLVYNFLIAGGICAVFFLWNLGKGHWRGLLPTYRAFAAVLALAAISVGLFGFNGASSIASLRNIIGPMLFTTVGFAVASRLHTDKRIAYLTVVIASMVISVGVYERFYQPDFWYWFNIEELWNKKGIANLNRVGIPSNWYAAERIGDFYLRRMVSSFADPVNLGAFFYLAFVSGYLIKSRLGMIIGVAGILLGISKGGFLGLLVFSVVYAYFRAPKIVFLLTVLMSSIIGGVFIYISFTHFTSSVYTHMSGSLQGFLALTETPMGLGLGRTGTLANQLGDLGHQRIRESGTGLIIGQLGAPGFAVFCYFIYSLARRLLSIPDKRVRIASLSLLLGITFNIVFNEVALSPNSSALYFVQVGVMISLYARPAMRLALAARIRQALFPARRVWLPVRPA
ncbi:MAG: hypothetical protein HYV63_06720 [Candidatus Schekmanbacteria bacterium]|nr:hypothetical protein [Candidatus Schekmanbacteria bacterium]